MVLMALISFSSPAMAQQAKKSSNQRRTTAVKKTTTKKSPAKKTATKKTATKKTATASQPVTVSSLKNEQQKVRKQIEEQQRKLKANERDVKKRLQNLLIINNEIADKRKSIDTIRHDITRLDGDITTLEAHIKYLDSELEERKQRFIKSMRYMHRNRNMQSKLMFIFSAKNLSQMYRRLRFVREYAAYQQTQAEAVKSMKTQVAEAFDELTDTKRQKSNLLVRDEQERRSLEGKQVEQQKMVTSLQKQQKTIQSIIDQQKKRDAELNAQIDRLIAQEIARAKARAEAEARKKAAEAEAKRKAEELARKKAAAEAARKENERRIAEAKAKEEKLRLRLVLQLPVRMLRRKLLLSVLLLRQSVHDWLQNVRLLPMRRYMRKKWLRLRNRQRLYILYLPKTDSLAVTSRAIEVDCLCLSLVAIVSSTTLVPTTLLT